MSGTEVRLCIGDEELKMYFRDDGVDPFDFARTIRAAAMEYDGQEFKFVIEPKE